MKYTNGLNEKEKTVFITGYKVEDGKIIMSTADGLIHKCDYNEKTEKAIIEIMEINANELK